MFFPHLLFPEDENLNNHLIDHCFSKETIWAFKYPKAEPKILVIMRDLERRALHESEILSAGHANVC